MHLKPRYSLLSLLVVTALVVLIVGGGVKLWRGPHWTVMSDPPTSEEQLLLNKSISLIVLTKYYGALDIRYQFTRGWNERHWHLLEGRNFQRPMILFGPPPGLASGYPWVLPSRKGSQPIVYWVAGVVQDARYVYLLAEDQQIFCFDYGSEEWLLPIELAQIPDAAVRERLAAEIRQLQESPKTAKVEG